MKPSLALLGLALIFIAGNVSADTDPYRGFKPLSGTINSCCGGDDCRALADDDVEAQPGGYWIKSKKWFVPNASAQPGPDTAHYHLCEYPLGHLNCFLIPAPGT